MFEPLHHASRWSWWGQSSSSEPLSRAEAGTQDWSLEEKGSNVTQLQGWGQKLQLCLTPRGVIYSWQPWSITAVLNTSFTVTAAAGFTSFHKVVSRRDSVHISALNTLSGEDKVQVESITDVRFPCYSSKCHYNSHLKACHAVVRMCYCKCA